MAVSTYTMQNGDGPYFLFPTTIEPSEFDIRHKRTTLVSDARSQRRQTRSVGGVRIEMSMKFPPLHKDNYATFAEFFRLLDGRQTIFALRMPLLRNDSAYSNTTLKVGEYYNRNDLTLDNQLMQYVSGTNGVDLVTDPPQRDGGTLTLSTYNQYRPTLKCSLATDTPTIQYGANGFIQYSMDVVERW